MKLKLIINESADLKQDYKFSGYAFALLTSWSDIVDIFCFENKSDCYKYIEEILSIANNPNNDFDNYEDEIQKVYEDCVSNCSELFEDINKNHIISSNGQTVFIDYDKNRYYKFIVKKPISI